MVNNFLRDVLTGIAALGKRRRKDRLKPHRARLNCENLEDRLTPSGTTVLPISVFLSHQGTTSVFTGPGVPDQIGWTDTVYDPGVDNNPSLLELVDYTGLEAKYLTNNGGPNLHTQETGFVTETPTTKVDPVTNQFLMEVTVNLETTNALTWVANVSSVNPNAPDGAVLPRELGYTVQDLLAHPNLTPAKSTVHFQMTFQEDVGAPLPDMAESLNEQNNPNIPNAAPPPPGFNMELWDIQAWGIGTLAAANDIGAGGTPLNSGQPALVYTTQVASYLNPNLPGTNNPNPPDGFFQEPVNIVPVASASAHVAYVQSTGPITPGTTGPTGSRGTLFVLDQSNGNDNVAVTPTAGGGARLESNLGNGNYPLVTGVYVGLGSGNNNVLIGNLPGAITTVTTLNGNNNIVVGNTAELVVHVGTGNNNIVTGNTNPAAQFIFVGGSGNNNIVTFDSTPSVILVAGNGNNNVVAGGIGDFIEVVGNGNNNILDLGSDDLVWLGGNGNNFVVNDGTGSWTMILSGAGHNFIFGPHS